MKITYIPQADDDSHTCVAYGIKFPANVPIEVDERRSIEVEETLRKDADDGTFKLVTIKKRLTIIELARGNPSFQVEGEAPKKKRGRPPNLRPSAIEELGLGVSPEDLKSYRPDDGMPADD